MVYVIDPFSAKFMKMVFKPHIYCEHIYVALGMNGLNMAATEGLDCFDEEKKTELKFKKNEV